MRRTAAVSEYLAGIGRRGGQAKGASKRRSTAHYRAAAAQSAEIRRALSRIREYLDVYPCTHQWFSSAGEPLHQRDPATRGIHVLHSRGRYVWARWPEFEMRYRPL